MSPLLPLLTVAALLCGASTVAAAADQVGIVKAVAGQVLIARGGTSLPGVPNQSLYLGDVVRTGADGKAGLILEDDTVVSLGPKSSIAIDNFLYRPEEKKLSLVARVFKGTVSFLSGRIARLAPDAVQIITPHGTLGVRGTHILVRVD